MISLETMNVKEYYCYKNIIYIQKIFFLKVDFFTSQKLLTT